jgi:Cu/Zn superoxide dismutase
LPEPNLFAEAEISALSASGISGIVRFDQDAEFLRISGRIDGVATGVHSLSVHEFDNCAMAGTAVTLSIAPDSEGYLGEIRAGENGIAEFELVETRLKLGAGADSILDRPIVIARPERTASQDSVNDIAGTPVGCGEITPVHAPTYTL